MMLRTRNDLYRVYAADVMSCRRCHRASKIIAFTRLSALARGIGPAENDWRTMKEEVKRVEILFNRNSGALKYFVSADEVCPEGPLAGDMFLSSQETEIGIGNRGSRGRRRLVCTPLLSAPATTPLAVADVHTYGLG